MNRKQDWYLWFICSVAALGGFLFGYDWVVIAGAKPFYEKYFSIADLPWWQGTVITTALVGCLVGSILTGLVADRFGRKPLLIASAFLFVVSSIGTALADSLGLFMFYRWLGGLGIGIASNTSPLYIAEVSPPQTRGRLVTVNQLALVVGMLTAQIVNYSIAKNVVMNEGFENATASWLIASGWRWMFGAGLLPAILFMLLVVWIPESPRWLVKAGRADEARSVLSRFVSSTIIDGQLQVIADSIHTEKKLAANLTELLARPNLRPLVLGVLLAIFQQWCGINVIFNYAEEIFSAAGYGVSSILFNIMVTGLVNFVFTFVAIATVDKIGRRRFIVGGSVGLAMIYLALGFCYYGNIRGTLVLSLVVCAIACYAMTLAPVVWVVLSEIFPTPIRGTAMAVAVLSLWMASAILTITFPVLNQSLGTHGTFWIYSLICLIGARFFYKRLPETCGKSLEEIQDYWSDPNRV
jgi:MFS transporter, SP family, arabinose:H+ symporter